MNNNNNTKIILFCLIILTIYRLLSKISPSEKYRAVVREYDGKKYLEVWKNNSFLMRVVDLNAISDSNIHGLIYTDCKYYDLI